MACMRLPASWDSIPQQHGDCDWQFSRSNYRGFWAYYSPHRHSNTREQEHGRACHHVWTICYLRVDTESSIRGHYRVCTSYRSNPNNKACLFPWFGHCIVHYISVDFIASNRSSGTGTSAPNSCATTACYDAAICADPPDTHRPGCQRGTGQPGSVRHRRGGRSDAVLRCTIVHRAPRVSVHGGELQVVLRRVRRQLPGMVVQVPVHGQLRRLLLPLCWRPRA